MDLSRKSAKDDFALIVEGQKIYTAKLVLMFASPVFDKMLTSYFKEKENEELELPDKKYADVLEFVKCIHPGFLAPVTMTNVFAVLPLANEYLVHHLMEQCETVLCTNVGSTTSIEELCYHLVIANKFQLKIFDKKCQEIAGDRYTHDNRSRFSEAANKYNVPFESQAIFYQTTCATLSRNIKDVLKAYNSVKCPSCKENAHECNVKRSNDKMIQTIRKILGFPDYMYRLTECRAYDTILNM